MELPAIGEIQRTSSWDKGVNCCLVGGLVVQELHLSLGYVYTPPTPTNQIEPFAPLPVNAAARQAHLTLLHYEPSTYHGKQRAILLALLVS